MTTARRTPPVGRLVEAPFGGVLAIPPDLDHLAIASWRLRAGPTTVDTRPVLTDADLVDVYRAQRYRLARRKLLRVAAATALALTAAGLPPFDLHALALVGLGLLAALLPLPVAVVTAGSRWQRVRAPWLLTLEGVPGRLLAVRLDDLRRASVRGSFEHPYLRVVDRHGTALRLGHLSHEEEQELAGALGRAQSRTGRPLPRTVTDRLRLPALPGAARPWRDWLDATVALGSLAVAGIGLLALALLAVTGG